MDREEGTAPAIEQAHEEGARGALYVVEEGEEWGVMVGTSKVERVKLRGDEGSRRRLFVGEAFAHPAKGHLGVWALMIERYSQPGDTVLDPMSGSGATLLGALMGRNVICVELERHFVEPMWRSWEKMRNMPMLGHEMGEATVIQGDARALPLPDASVEAAITSPPYEEGLGHPSNPDRDILRKHGRTVSGSNAYTRPVDAIVTSPPFQDQEATKAGKFADPVKSAEMQAANYRSGASKGHFASAGAILRAMDKMQPYAPGSTENIGNMKGSQYFDAMKLCYAECWRVLKPGGILALVLKGFTRDGQYVDLPGQTEALLLEAGWQKHDEWRRELWSLSFWRILQKRRDPAAFDERLNFEEVKAFRKGGC